MRKQLMFLILLLFSIQCKKNPAGIDSWSEINNGLRFRIWTDTSTYEEDESVWLYVEFQNTSNSSMVVLVNAEQPFEDVPLYDFKRITIIAAPENNDDSTITIIPKETNEFHACPDLVKLTPGQRYQEKTNVTSGSWYVYEEPLSVNSFTYFEPGRYLLKATYIWNELPYPTPERQQKLESLAAPLWNGYLESNTISLSVITKLE